MQRQSLSWHGCSASASRKRRRPLLQLRRRSGLGSKHSHESALQLQQRKRLAGLLRPPLQLSRLPPQRLPLPLRLLQSARERLQRRHSSSTGYWLLPLRLLPTLPIRLLGGSRRPLPCSLLPPADPLVAQATGQLAPLLMRLLCCSAASSAVVALAAAVVVGWGDRGLAKRKLLA